MIHEHWEKVSQGLPLGLAQSIAYSLQNGGKRIRPLITLNVSKALNLSENVGQTLAVALEMIHTFSLIHDDLPCMDDDDIRRNQPTNHKVYGEAQALLAGDSLILLAFQLLLDLRKDPNISLEALNQGISRLNQCVGPHGLIGGQSMEFSSSDYDLPTLKKIHEKKTGALFHACFLVPCDFKSLSDDDPLFQTIHNISEHYGLLFQLLDDMEDASEKPLEKWNVNAFESREALQDQASQWIFQISNSIETLNASSQPPFKVLFEPLEKKYQQMFEPKDT